MLKIIVLSLCYVTSDIFLEIIFNNKKGRVYGKIS